LHAKSIDENLDHANSFAENKSAKLDGSEIESLGNRSDGDESEKRCKVGSLAIGSTMNYAEI
jgi:hypothetical protein